MSRPYQPSLLRLLHGATALLVPLAWLSGLLVYSSYDGRFSRLPFSLPGEWIDIHGTVGVLLWPLALLFSLYALTVGRLRLRQPANALALLALVMAVGSGKLMQEDWLRDGQLHHIVYSVHLRLAADRPRCDLAFGGGAKAGWVTPGPLNGERSATAW